MNTDNFQPHISNVLRQLYEESGLSKRAFAKKIGYSPSILGDLISGQKACGWQMAKNLAEATGQALIVFIPPEYRSLLGGASDKTIEPVPEVAVPIRTLAAAGYPMVSEDLDLGFKQIPESWMEDPSHPTRYQFVRVDGDSMDGPGTCIKDKDLCLVDRFFGEISNGDIVICRLADGESTLKRYRWSDDDGGFYLEPGNPEHPTRFIKAKERPTSDRRGSSRGKVEITGKVIKVLRDLP